MSEITEEIEPAKLVQIAIKGELFNGDSIFLLEDKGIDPTFPDETVNLHIINTLAHINNNILKVPFLSLYAWWKGDKKLKIKIVNKEYKVWEKDFILPHHGHLAEVLGREKNTEDDKKVIEMVETVIITHEAKGYKYSCLGEWEGGRCSECAQKFLVFTTQDINEAFKHSIENSMPMWFSKD